MLLKHVDHRCTCHLIEHVLDVKLDDHVPRMCLQMHADKTNQDIQAPIRACTELLWFVKLPQQDLVQKVDELRRQEHLDD